MSEFTNFTEKDYQSYINLLRLAFDAVLDAKTLEETLEDAKKKASWAAVGQIHSGFGEFEIVQARQQIADLEAQLAEARRHSELLRAVAEAAEWGGRGVEGDRECPVCGNEKFLDKERHKSNCPYQDAIDGGALEDGEE